MPGRCWRQRRGLRRRSRQGRMLRRRWWWWRGLGARQRQGVVREQGRGQSRVEGGRGVGEEAAATFQVDAVVEVAAIGRTAADRHQPGGTQAAQVVGDQRLGLARQGGQLADLAVASSQLGQQAPAQLVTEQEKDLRRRRNLSRACSLHTPKLHQMSLIHQYRLMEFTPGAPGRPCRPGTCQAGRRSRTRQAERASRTCRAERAAPEVQLRRCRVEHAGTRICQWDAPGRFRGGRSGRCRARYAGRPAAVPLPAGTAGTRKRAWRPDTPHRLHAAAGEL